MPASEQTWRNQRIMHVVFGVTTLVMLLSTIWMIAKDYSREWKDYQADYFQISRWSDQATLRQTEVQSAHDLRARRAELREAQSQAVESATLDQFKALVDAENQRLAQAGDPAIDADFAAMDELRDRLNAASDRAAELRQAADAAHQQVVGAVAAYQAARSATLASDEPDEATEQALRAVEAARTALQEAEEARLSAEDAAIDAKEALLSSLNALVSEARRREDEFVRNRKFVAATHTEQLSLLDAANAAGGANIGALQAQIDQLAAEMSNLDARAAAAKNFRMSLETIVRSDIRGEELEVQKEVDAIEQELDRLDAAIDQQGDNWKKQFVRAPIMEAFDTSDMQIDNGWLPELKINYNFSDVARFDRCATCHKAIEKTAPGSAIEPAYPTIQPEDQVITVQLATPESPPARTLSPETGELEDPSFRNVYGFTLAERGQLDRDAVTVEIVLPESLAAKAGLQTGDVIEEIAGGQIYNEDLVRHYLLEAADWGRPVEVTIRRGLPHPYTSHPRLDLYVGSMSPHPKGEFGCTICHDGQGSATTFKYASHSPNSPAEATQWRREHDWFFNHHWIFPMTPRRFLESNCLKCHHEVVELEPSERFPDPPAPKLVSGWKAILNYGCYGCHEVNGFDGGKRVGPDLRSEPNYFAAAQQILRDGNLSDNERAWALAVVANTYDDAARNKLRIAVEADAALASDDEPDTEPRLSAATHKLGELLKDVENPGTLRRVGPSLRFLAHKVEFPWLYSWIERPSSFRPSTKMPQFFGQFNHLDDQEEVFSIPGLDEEDDEELLTDHEFTERMEAIEVRAITEYLLSASGDFDYLTPPEGITEAPSAERGKALFQTRGCLACHTHKDFPGIASDQGPDLSTLAAKLNTEKGRQWLYTWIRQPTEYHVRTNMPDLFLEPIVHADATGQPTGAVTDPAADIVAYLLGVPADWTPQGVPQREALTADELKALESLALEWMTANFSARLSKEYLQSGIPESVAGTLKGDEIVFVGMDPNDRVATTLKYVGMRSIGKYGCFGCHDIPGFEAAKPIGTGLADWGRKDPSKLAFEQIHKFLMTHGIEDDQDPHEHVAHGEEGHGLDATQFDADTGFYVQALNMHQREGFIWQKLRMPRSYDYLKTQNKGYNERLRMPQFPLTEGEREEIITFVLGLTAETPSGQYVFQPNARQRAIMDGRLLLTKYNCGGCHTLQMERWQFAFEPGTIPVVAPDDYPFLAPEFSGEAVLASREPDRRGMFHTEFTGMPVLGEQTGQPQRVDEGGLELTPEDTDLAPFYRFTLYEPALVEGQSMPSGQQLFVPATWERYGPASGKVYPVWGGDLARYLFPHVLAMERQAGTQIATPEAAWGWLPPTLHAEGRKVQTDWLHDFLLNPYAIRPAVVLRMPRFNMSTDEASRLANYFAAVDNADYPYEYNERQQSTYLDVVRSERPSHLDDAFRIVLDSKNFCAQCHSVGDYQTQQVLRQRGPNLAQAGQRLRAGYLRRYIANPQKILPYTGMPVNFPYGQTVAQNLYQGSGIEQIDAVVDLLANYDLFIQQHYQISPLVEAAARDAQDAAAQAGAAGGE